MSDATSPAGPGSLALAVRGVSKFYQIYARPQDRLKQALFRNRRRYFEEFWALRGIDLEVAKGETVGLIGRNGSGKSTLLQIICGTLRPNMGSVEVNGRVSALLELGSGFNPDFTGRENVYLNSAILGLSKAETDEAFDRIVGFADIGPHLDQPVKTYSSGMMMRLAFAVAINVHPDILIVDEALSVGDEAFQRRCIARIETMRQSGCTILFVSHSANQIVELCDRAVFLDRGEKLFDGSPRLGVNYYQKFIYMPPDRAAQFREDLKNGTAETRRIQGREQKAADDFNPGMVPKSTTEFEPRGARIEEPRIETLDGRQVNLLVRNRRYRMRFQVRFQEGGWMVAAGTRIKTLQGVELGGASTIDTDRMIDYIPPGTVAEVSHEFTCALIEGTYFVNAGVSGLIEGERHWMHRIVDVLMFSVVPQKLGFSNGPVDFAFDSKVVVE